MGYAKTYRLSKNKMNPAEVTFYSQTSLGTSATLSWVYSSTSSGRTVRIPVKPSTQYRIKPYGDALSSVIWRIATCAVDDYPTENQTVVPVQTVVSSTAVPVAGTYVWTGSNVKYLIMQITSSLYTDINDFKNMIGIYEVTGESQPTPATCEPYNVTGWYDWVKEKTASGWTDGDTKKYDSGSWTPTTRQIAAEKAALTRKINSLRDTGEE